MVSVCIWYSEKIPMDNYRLENFSNLNWCICKRDPLCALVEATKEAIQALKQPWPAPPSYLRVKLTNKVHVYLAQTFLLKWYARH